MKRLNAEVRRLRLALEIIMEMARLRKSCIRMPDGTMLDNYCRSALSPNTKVSGASPTPHE